MICMKKTWSALGLLTLAATACLAGTEAKLFKGREQETLYVRNYKRGLFFGSCGPSTHSLQWEYSLELKGIGPSFDASNIVVKDISLQPVPISGGKVVIDEQRHLATIQLQVGKEDSLKNFPHNGQYRFTPPR